jgi:isoleucyl-tRNA synthetase
LLSNLYDFVPARDLLPDGKLRELDRLALSVLRDRDQQIFDAYQGYSFHDAVRLIVDYLVTVSAEYLGPIKDALYCEGANSRERRSVQTALYEMVKTVATWIAPVMCFSAQDVADELERQTGTPFDVHGQVWQPAKGASSERWQSDLRPRREEVLGKLEAFRAAGHKALEAHVTVTPTTSERAAWKKDLAHLTELCEVSRIELSDHDAARTEVVVAEAPSPECPRCWRRTETVSGHAQDPNLCIRCASVVSSLSSSEQKTSP